MRIAVLHNAVSQQDTIEDQDVLVQADVVAESLGRLGHEHSTIACTLDLDSLREQLLQLRPDLVFNLVEALHGDDSLVYLPPAVLDSLGAPYTGAHAESLFLTTHKLLAKERLANAGLPTPAWIVQNTIAGGTVPTFASAQMGLSHLPHYPAPLPTNKSCTAGRPTAHGEETISKWIVKGVWDQASRDMDDDAVFAGDLAEVHRRLNERVTRTGRPSFTEEYIEGREFNLALLIGPNGVEAMPPAEIDFSTFPAEKPRIVGHRAKWQADSFEYNNTPRHFDFPAADKALLDQLRDLARRCWSLFNLRGWARVDFRVDQKGNPWILEINANPCLSPDTGFAAALHEAEIGIDQAIQRIVEEI